MRDGYGKHGMLKQGLRNLVLTARALWTPVAFGVAGAVFDAGGRVLLVRQSYVPGWRLPAGGMSRGEVPEAVLRREMAEEVGLSGGSASLFGVYARRAGLATNVIALYRMEGGTVAFRPNLEVREIRFADPAAPPDGTTPATRRRLAELLGGERSEVW